MDADGAERVHHGGQLIQIRHATPADARSIARLLTELGYPTAPDDIPGRLVELQREGGAALVAVNGGGEPIAVATTARYSALHKSGQVCYITAFVTDPETRGRGVGRRLLAAIEEWARAHGCERISVTSAEHRAGAHAFYERCGIPYSGRRFSRDIESTPSTEAS
jgi:GNAT superfamily N-acetyltransferase